MAVNDSHLIESGGQVSNLRPSAPKTTHRTSTVLGFQFLSDFLLGSAKFVLANKAIFDGNLSAKYHLRKI